MAVGLERFERLFSAKRKASAVSTTEPSSPISTSSEQQFPSPSFIRPKAARMAAREEVIRKHRPATRSRSAADLLAVKPLSRASSRNSICSDAFDCAPPAALRIPSTGNDRQDRLFSELEEFQFPKPPSQHREYHGHREHHGHHDHYEPTRHRDLLPLLIAFDPECASLLSTRQSQRSSSPFGSEAPLNRLDTPPSTDPEDNGVCTKTFMNKKLPPIPRGAPPTPSESPELSPMQDSQLEESKPIDILDKTLFRDIQLRLGEPVDQTTFTEPADQSTLRRSFSQSSVGSPSHHYHADSELREPDFDEFLHLSDDDIAEEVPETPEIQGPELPPTPTTMASTVVCSEPRISSMLTLTPPCTSRPATAAAFEVARIAKRYNFDFVYVVNLWQENTITRPNGTGLGLAPNIEFQEPEKQMEGRLLAAYGLQHVKSPFRISSTVHSKILRTDGWIEYRGQDSRTDEFPRGYARSYYTGRFARSGSIDSTSSASSSSTISTRSMDRGIVFAAYRKPRADGNIRFSDQQELKKVDRDAEVLVEMLIDIHIANRLRHIQPQGLDDTGPMPIQEI